MPLIRWLSTGSIWAFPSNVPLSVALELGSLVILMIATTILAAIAWKTDHGLLKWFCQWIVFLNFIKTLVAGPLDSLSTLLAVGLAMMSAIWLGYSVYCTGKMLWMLMKGIATFVEAVREAAHEANKAVGSPPTS